MLRAAHGGKEILRLLRPIGDKENRESYMPNPRRRKE